MGKKRGRPRKKPLEPAPEIEGQENFPGMNGLQVEPETEAEPEYGQMPELHLGESAGPVAPVVEQSERARFETPVEPDVLVTSHETFRQLGQFFDSLPNRSRFELQVWRCDPNAPHNFKKREWCGRIPLPEGMTLEEALDKEFGGGVYFWRLACDGRHSSRSDLPGDLQAMPMLGYVRLATPPKDERAEGEREAREQHLYERLEKVQREKEDAMLGLLKDMLRESKSNAASGTDSLVKMMTVMMTAQAQQMQMQQANAQQQSNFLLQLLAMNEKKGSEAREERDELFRVLLEGVRNDATGDKPFSHTLVEQLPKILEGLAKVPALAQASPRAQAPLPPPPPPPPQVPAPVVVQPGVVSGSARHGVAAPPVPAQPVPEDLSRRSPAGAEPDDYPTSIAKCCIRHWQGGAPASEAAAAVEAIGTEDNFNDLLDTDPEAVVGFLAMGFAAANNVQAPPELLAYARATLQTLHDAYPEEPPAPAAPTPLPAPGFAPGIAEGLRPGKPVPEAKVEEKKNVEAGPAAPAASG
jgi:hypothetical protein